MASGTSHIRITADVEVSRLTDVLHARQCHPDYDYAVTYVGNTAHKPLRYRDGWERNPAADGDAVATWPAKLGWRRRKHAEPYCNHDAAALTVVEVNQCECGALVPLLSSFEDDAEYGAGWNEPPVNLA